MTILFHFSTFNFQLSIFNLFGRSGYRRRAFRYIFARPPAPAKARKGCRFNP